MCSEVGKVMIVMGSDSDLPIMKKAVEVLEAFKIEYEVIISSAHRVPDKTADYAKNAAARGFDVIIAAAGLAAHLPGVVASHTTLPVIGVPIGGGPLKGLDALYAIVQMPSGIPVACMAIDGAKNAALFAVQILSTKDYGLAQKMQEYRAEMAKEVEGKAARLAEVGVHEYSV